MKKIAKFFVLMIYCLGAVASSVTYQIKDYVSADFITPGYEYLGPEEDYDGPETQALWQTLGQLFCHEGWSTSFSVHAEIKDYLRTYSCKLAYTEKNEIVGAIFYQVHHDHTAIIKWLVVDKNYRNTGCGRWLMQKTLEDIFVKSKAHLTPCTVSLNPSYSAIRFYSKLGFKVNEEKTSFIEGTSDRIYIMEKVLGAHSKEIAHVINMRSTLTLWGYFSGVIKPLSYDSLGMSGFNHRKA